MVVMQMVVRMVRMVMVVVIRRLLMLVAHNCTGAEVRGRSH